MTTTNVSDTSRNGHAKHMPDNRTPEEIQLEIARTKSAITEDLRVLSERFNPQQLRESARELMHDARLEANHLIEDAKAATIGSLIGAKDRAVESVKESVHEKVQMLGDQARLIGDQAVVLGDRARRGAEVGAQFVSRNALSFSLLGAGLGWLAMAYRNYRRQQLMRLPPASQNLRFSDTVRGVATEAVRSVATPATRAVDRARDEARSALAASRSLAYDSRELAVRTGSGMGRALRQTGQAAADHKLAVVALTVAAGLGIGLLLPIGQRPRRALRNAGERAWAEAQTRAHRFAERADVQARQLGERAHLLTERIRA